MIKSYLGPTNLVKMTRNHEEWNLQKVQTTSPGQKKVGQRVLQNQGRDLATILLNQI